MIKRKISFFILLGYLSQAMPAQIPKSLTDTMAVNPVAIPIFLSGNFAEPRSTHFHTGIDIKTNGTTGIPVFATASGSVVRIRVEPSGYGRSLYLQHDSGLTSVYGHLQSFNEDIEAYVVNEQYRKESFSVDLYPPADLFRYQQGHVIAKSGNTGSSDGPHLHYELRETKSGNPVNPLKGKIKVEDHIPPILTKLYVYNQTRTYYDWEPVTRTLLGSSGKYQLTDAGPVPVADLSTFGIEAYELLDGSSNHCGIYSIRLSLDGNPIFGYELDEISFQESRNIYSFMDYRQFQKGGKPVIRLYVQPNNHAGVYTWSSNRGYVQFMDDLEHLIKIEATDASGNQSTLTFKVKRSSNGFKQVPDTIFNSREYVPYASDYEFKQPGIQIKIPSGSLFEDLYFGYKVESSRAGTFGQVHRVHMDIAGMLKPFTIQLDLSPVPDQLVEKAVIVRISDNGSLASIGGRISKDAIRAESSRFGRYTIAVDTTAPSVKPLNFNAGKTVSGLRTLQFRVRDDLSGIGKFRAEVDGKWALMEYDPKQSLLTYNIDYKRLNSESNHEFNLTIEDVRGNINTFRINFKN